MLAIRGRSVLLCRTPGRLGLPGGIHPQQPARGHFSFPKNMFRGTPAGKYLKAAAPEDLIGGNAPSALDQLPEHIRERMSPEALRRLTQDTRHLEIRKIIEDSDRRLGVNVGAADIHDTSQHIENMDPEKLDRFLRASESSLSHIPDGAFASELDHLLIKSIREYGDHLREDPQSLVDQPGSRAYDAEPDGSQTVPEAVYSERDGVAPANPRPSAAPAAAPQRPQPKSRLAAKLAAKDMPPRPTSLNPDRPTLTPEAVKRLVAAAASSGPSGVRDAAENDPFADDDADGDGAGGSFGASQAGVPPRMTFQQQESIQEKVKRHLAEDPTATKIELDLRDNFRLNQGLKQLEEEFQRRRQELGQDPEFDAVPPTLHQPYQDQQQQQYQRLKAATPHVTPSSSGADPEDVPGPDVAPLLPYGTPSLFQDSRRIPEADMNDPRFRQNMRELLATKHFHKAMGLAAPQIGWNARVIAFGFDAAQLRRDYQIEVLPQEIQDALLNCSFQVWVNPEIVEVSRKKLWFWESCLSVPGLFGWVERPSKVKVRGFDKDGKPQEQLLTGLSSRIFQHERDHLDGILFTQRVTNPRYIISEQMMTAGTEGYHESCLPPGARGTAPGLLSEIE